MAKNEIGDAVLRITPSFEGFAAKLREGLREYESVKLDITVTPAGWQKFAEEVERNLQAIEAAARLDVDMHVNSTEARAEVDRVVKEGSAKKITPKVDAETAQAKAKIDALRRLEEANDIDLKVSVDDRGLAAQLAAFREAIEAGGDGVDFNAVRASLDAAREEADITNDIAFNRLAAQDATAEGNEEELAHAQEMQRFYQDELTTRNVLSRAVDDQARRQTRSNVDNEASVKRVIEESRSLVEIKEDIARAQARGDDRELAKLKEEQKILNGFLDVQRIIDRQKAEEQRAEDAARKKASDDELSVQKAMQAIVKERAALAKQAEQEQTRLATERRKEEEAAIAATEKARKEAESAERAEEREKTAAASSLANQKRQALKEAEAQEKSARRDAENEEKQLEKDRAAARRAEERAAKQADQQRVRDIRDQDRDLGQGGGEGKFRVVQGFQGLTLFNLANIAAAGAGVALIVGELGGLIAAAGVAATALGAIGAAGLVGGMGVFKAFSELKQANESAAGKVEDTAKKLREQREELQRVEDAQQAVADSARNLARDTTKVAEATRDATRDLRDMNFQLQDAKLSQEDAAIGVARSRERLSQVVVDYRRGDASQLDVQEAQLGVKQSEQRLRESQASYADKRVDTADANSKGVSGSEQVIGAKETVADDIRRLAKSQRELADAQRDVGKSANDASAPENRFNAAMAKLAPNARDFVNQVRGLGSAFKPLVQATQNRLFDGLGDTVNTVARTQLPEMQRGLVQMAGVLNGVVSSSILTVSNTFKEFSNNGTFTAFLNAVQSSFRNFAPVIDSIVRALTAMTIAMGPQLGTFFGQLATYINDATPFFSELGNLFLVSFGDALPILVEFLNALLPLLREIMPGIVTIFGAITDALANNQGRIGDFGSELTDAFVAFIQVTEPLIPLVLNFISAITQLFTAVATSPFGGFVTAFIALTLITRTGLGLFIGLGNTLGRTSAAMLSVRNATNGLRTAQAAYNGQLAATSAASSTVFARIGRGLNSMVQGVKGGVATAASGIAGLVATAGRGLASGVSTVGRGLADMGRTAGGAITRTGSAIGGAIGTAASAVASNSLKAGRAAASAIGAATTATRVFIGAQLQAAAGATVNGAIAVAGAFARTGRAIGAATVATRIFIGAQLQAAAGATVNGIIRMASAIGRVSTALRIATIAQIQMNLAALANPYVFLAVAIAAIVTAIVVAFVKVKAFREGFIATFKAIGDIIMWAGKVVLQAFLAPIRIAFNAVLLALRMLRAGWDIAFATFMIPLNVLTAFVNFTFENISAVVSGFINFFKKLFTGDLGGAVSAIGGIFTSVFENIGNLFSRIGRAMMGFVDIAKAVGSGIRTAFSGLTTILKTPINVVGRLLQLVPGSIFGKKIPGVSTLREWGVRMARLRDGGSVQAGVDQQGVIQGPGTSTSDSILGYDNEGPTVYVSRDEGIVNARGLKKHRAMFEAINRDDPGLPHLKTGGAADGSQQEITPQVFNDNWSKFFAKWAGGNTPETRDVYLMETPAINRLYRTGQLPPSDERMQFNSAWDRWFKSQNIKGGEPRAGATDDGSSASDDGRGPNLNKLGAGPSNETPEEAEKRINAARNKYLEANGALYERYTTGQMPPTPEQVIRDKRNYDAAKITFNTAWMQYFNSKALNGNDPALRDRYLQNNPELNKLYRSGKLPPGKDQNFELKPGVYMRAPVAPVDPNAAPVDPAAPPGADPAFGDYGTTTTPGGTPEYGDFPTTGYQVDSLNQGGALLPPMPSSKGSEEHWQVDTVHVARAVAQQFPQIQTIGGWRPVDAYPDHPSGRAADIMIPGYDTPAGKALGDQVADYVMTNKAAFNVDYIIWQQEYRPANGQSNKMEDRGSPTQNHMDHVHVTTVGGGMPNANQTYTAPGVTTTGGFDGAGDLGYNGLQGGVDLNTDGYPDSGTGIVGGGADSENENADNLSVQGTFRKGADILSNGLLDFFGLKDSVLSESNPWNSATRDGLKGVYDANVVPKDFNTLYAGFIAAQQGDGDGKGGSKKAPSITPNVGGGNPNDPRTQNLLKNPGPDVSGDYTVQERQDQMAAEAMRSQGKAAVPGGSIKDIAKSAVASYGWNIPPEWPALDTLVQNESSWNPKAQNPGSTAYGLGQFLDDTWATVGGTKTDDPFKQMQYMAKYIKQRQDYGTPSKALALWESRSPHWYANGGPVSGMGGPRDDMVRAFLSNGEFVMQEASARFAGPLLGAMNANPELARQITSSFMSTTEQNRVMGVQSTRGGFAQQAPLTDQNKSRNTPAPEGPRIQTGDVYTRDESEFVRRLEDMEAKRSLGHLARR